MTIFACRIAEPGYSVYEFLDDLEVGFKKFETMEELEEYVIEHYLDDNDNFLYPKDLFEKGEYKEVFLYIINTIDKTDYSVKVSVDIDVIGVKFSLAKKEKK